MMPLTGKAKTDYQREYMRKRRSNAKPVSVRPDIRPKLTLEQAQQAYDNLPDRDTNLPEPQNYNPMMVGYVPPGKAKE